MSHTVYFVSFGPGDPELLTLRGYRILKQSDVIVYPGSLIEESFLKEFKAEKINSHGKKLEEIVELIEQRVKEGKRVSRVVSGDASLFSAVKEQMELLEKRGIECEVVPGVSSVFASSAILKAELTLPSVASGVAILRAKGKTLDRDYIEEVAKTDLTLAVLLSADRIDEITRRVAEHRGEDTPVAVVYRATQREEKVIEGTLRDIAEKVKRAGIKTTAVILIGEALKPEKYERSKLYG